MRRAAHGPAARITAAAASATAAGEAAPMMAVKTPKITGRPRLAAPGRPRQRR